MPSPIATPAVLRIRSSMSVTLPGKSNWIISITKDNPAPARSTFQKQSSRLYRIGIMMPVGINMQTFPMILLGVFYEYLGFVVSSHLENSPFFLKGSQIGAACKKKAILERHRMVAAGKTGKPYVYHSQSARNSRNIIRKLSCDADGVRVK